MRRPIRDGRRLGVGWLALAVGLALAHPAPGLDFRLIAGWRTIQVAEPSPDGKWFAYVLVPADGDSELVVRSIETASEMRFSIGFVPFPERGLFRFSGDSKWLGFFATAARDRRGTAPGPPVRQSLTLLRLHTGEKRQFDNVQSFTFPARQSDRVLLLQTAEGRENTNANILMMFSTDGGLTVEIPNVTSYACNADGEFCAWAIDRKASGGGLYLYKTATGATSTLDNSAAGYRNISWAPQGPSFAALECDPCEPVERARYAALGFSDVGSATVQKVIVGPELPSNWVVSPYRRTEWLYDGRALGLGVVKAAKKSSSAEASGVPDLVIWSSGDDRLPQQRRLEERKDREASTASAYWLEAQTLVRLGDDDISEVRIHRSSPWALGIGPSIGARSSGDPDRQRLLDLYAIDVRSGERKSIVTQINWQYGLSPDGTHALYFSDGQFHAYDFEKGVTHHLGDSKRMDFRDNEDDRYVVKPPAGAPAWSADGRSILVSDGWDIWQLPIESGKPNNLTSTERKGGIRFRRWFQLDPEESVVDVSRPMYLEAIDEDTKKSGVLRLSGGQLERLRWEDAAFGTLLKAREANVFFYTRETSTTFPNYYTSDEVLRNVTQITNANPQVANQRLSAGSRLIEYLSESGKKLRAALFLPGDYEPGKSYPTIVFVYEKFSDTLNKFVTPSLDSFNRSVYTSNGYAVLMPDIDFVRNDPGKSAVWSVVPAVEAAAKTGIVDRDRVGLHGHSWGGYVTAFLVGQTNIFKAAAAGAPITDMASLYNLVYQNSGKPNHFMFESGQARLSSTLWADPQAFMRNSPVYYAPQVRTPLLIQHNDADGSVDFTQGVQLFNALRRLGKPAVLLQYRGENHGLRKTANRKDFATKLMEFFDYYLKGCSQPAWLASVSNSAAVVIGSNESRPVAGRGGSCAQRP